MRKTSSKVKTQISLVYTKYVQILHRAVRSIDSQGTTVASSDSKDSDQPKIRLG